MSRLSLLYDVHRVAFLTDRLVEESLADQDLSGTDFALYSFLVVNGPTTVSEVGTGIAMSIASASKLLAKVDERGHLERRQNPDDGRSTLVELSEDGRKAHRTAAPAFGAALRRVIKSLGGSVDDVRWSLARLDEALSGALDQSPVSAGEPPDHRTLTYPGAPITAAEEDEARRYIAWLQYQGEQP